MRSHAQTRTGRAVRSHRAPAGLPTAVLLAAILAAGAIACDRRAPAPPASTQFDANYLDALAAANGFCDAWRRGDVETGKKLLSVRVKRAFPDAAIHDAIAGPPNPQHVAYELSDGQARADRMTFRLRLLYRFAGRAQQRIEARAEQVVLRRDADGRWLVDRFPLLDEPN